MVHRSCYQGKPDTSQYIQMYMASCSFGCIGLYYVSLWYVRLTHDQMIINSSITNFHLTNSSNRLVFNTVCGKLKLSIRIIFIQHNIHTKLHEFPSSSSLVIKYVQTDNAS
jgi:hypothetical protein